MTIAVSDIKIDIADGFDVFGKSFREAVRPRPNLDVCQWADCYRHLAGNAASEPGKYYSSRTPLVIEVMRSISPQSDAEIIIYQGPTQEAKTEAGNNGIYYRMDYDPMSIALYLPTDTDAGKHSKLKVQPTIEATPVLREKFDMMPHGSNNVLTKIFPGGVLSIMGAESAKNFRNISYGFVQGTEIDEWPNDVEGQGDPTELLIKRLGTYLQKGGKVYFDSSPTIHGLSKIEKWFNLSDQRYYYVPWHSPDSPEEYARTALPPLHIDLVKAA